VGVLAHQPRIGLLHVDAELFVQLAPERSTGRLSWLDLAAGKLPIPGVDLALRTLGEKKFSARPLNHSGNDLNRSRSLTAPHLAFSAATPSAPLRLRAGLPSRAQTATLRVRCVIRAAAPIAALPVSSARPRSPARHIVAASNARSSDTRP